MRAAPKEQPKTTEAIANALTGGWRSSALRYQDSGTPASPIGQGPTQSNGMCLAEFTVYAPNSCCSKLSSATQIDLVNTGEKMQRRAGVKMYHGWI
jgi:hypothetical protein